MSEPQTAAGRALLAWDPGEGRGEEAMTELHGNASTERDVILAIEAEARNATLDAVLPSGRVVKVPPAVAATASTLADFCPDRHEHTPTGWKGYVATIHPPCGLAVVYVKRARRG